VYFAGYRLKIELQFGEFGDVKRYYFQTKLVEPLKKERKYKLSFYVSLADYSSIAVENIAAFMFDKPIIKRGDSPNALYQKTQSSQGTSLDLMKMVALTKIKNTKGIIKDMENWTLIEEEFTAGGKMCCLKPKSTICYLLLPPRGRRRNRRVSIKIK